MLLLFPLPFPFPLGLLYDLVARVIKGNQAAPFHFFPPRKKDDYRTSFPVLFCEMFFPLLPSTGGRRRLLFSSPFFLPTWRELDP